jgi:putative ABC transport system substrate-binding protein
MTGDVVGKWLELLKELLPGLSRVAVLWNPDNAIFQRQMLQSAERAGAVLGLQLRQIGARNSDEIDRNFETISKENIDALRVMADPTLIANRARIIDFAARRRLPAIYGSPSHAEDGGLISYSPDMFGQFHRAAAYVDRISKNQAEAEYRYALTRLRENGESIAILRGQNEERNSVDASFKAVLGTW